MALAFRNWVISDEVIGIGTRTSFSAIGTSNGLRSKGEVQRSLYALTGARITFCFMMLAFARAMGAFRWLRDRYAIIQVVSGLTLVALGLLLFFHRDWWLHVALNRFLDDIGLTSP